MCDGWIQAQALEEFWYNQRRDMKSRKSESKMGAGLQADDDFVF